MNNQSGAIKLSSPLPACGKCGAKDVKIYRWYGGFRREETDRCNECIDQESKGWMVPCILDKEGNAWGYTSVPDDACQAFYSLPEKNSRLPGWDCKKDKWSDSKAIAQCPH